MTEASYGRLSAGKRIALLRPALNLSQSEFAEKIGVKRGEVGAWESGGRRPSVEKAKPIADIFGVTLDCIFLDISDHMPFGLMKKIVDQQPKGSKNARAFR